VAAAAPVLYHIEISHYNEKVRWALDYKRVPHVRRAPPPMMHTAWAFVMTRSMTFPVLRLDGERIGDSTRIIAKLEKRYPDPPLYPAAEEERQRALALEEFFDEELGPHIRRALFAELTRDRTSFAQVAVPRGGRVAQTVYKSAAPAAAPILRLRYGIKPELSGRRHPGPALDRHRIRLRAELQDRVVGELDPAGHARRVEHQHVAVALARGVELGQLQRARDHPLAVLRPGDPWVVELIVIAGQLQLEREANRRAGCEAVREVTL
jgi:glutathione S-transferase